MVLLELLSGLSGLVKVKHSVDLDSAVFKLHYRITAPMLFCFCLLVTANSLVGDPINCIHGDHPMLKTKVVNTYCWIHTTFTLPKYMHRGYGKGTGVLHPGVGPHDPSDAKVYHAYYQWVPFVLFLQGLMFYTPHWLWKTWEGCKLESIVMGLSQPVMNKEERREKINLLAEYLQASIHYHNFYAIKFFLCELLNLGNSAFNMWFMNRFLGGMFFRYGLDVLSFTETNQEERTDPMIVLFPRVTKCSFNMYGPSGTIESHDLMCVLALNIINEKIYVFLWFWFVILSVISFLALLYRLLVFCIPAIRSGLLQKRARLRYKTGLEAIGKKLQMVLALLGGLLGVAKVRYSHTFVDSWPFRLHYHWTTSFCILAGIIVIATDFVGDPMQCMVGADDAPKPITTYCWITSTYSINATSQNVHDGLHGLGARTSRYHEETYYAYYQWVPAVLFFQACLFYLPHIIWKCMEGKQMDSLLQDLNKNLFDNDAQKKKKNIVEYLKESWGLNVKYSVGYLVCESLNLVNVIGQMFLLDKFLGGVFLDYGTKVLNFAADDDNLRTDPMIKIFPRRAKCDFRYFGASGTVKKEDALCIMPQNIINEKVFIFMWFWFIFLAVVSSIQIVWRIALFSSSYLRLRLLSHRANMATPGLRQEQMIRHMQMGDFFLLDSIGQNLDPVNFRDILDGVGRAAQEVGPSAPPAGTYKSMYPDLPMETLVRNRRIDEPDAINAVIL